VRRLSYTFALTLAAAVVWPASNTADVADWAYYGGDSGGSRFSPLAQIDRANVHKLKVAWIYHTGDVSDGSIHPRKSLVFIGATWDSQIRAFDIETGKELWKAQLPAPAQATPMTYRVRGSGKQFVVIAAGGHGKLPIKLGDSLVAFTLP
jgi:glucose dehydrogenase